ncbi:hypothetical protein SAMN05216206_2772 [Pseudomonas guineae]|uniref:Uncharacterized protein n=1 Tax=Pseudomonas guineae TaxID=425504 RepID=A0A1I3KBW7_9PSED|nr:hypothetical protein [Pseudomonas guineae]SFI69840.1 hypothetical protein SAMN05216206_2772 [Pseudomonas guineae]
MTTSRIVATSDLSSQSSTGRVLEAVQELHALEQIVTREALIELLDLPATTIDDRVGTLVNAGMIVRVRRGIYAPAEVHDAARVISKTILPCGTVKIDIGDDVLTLTPKEDRMLAAMLAGVAMQAVGIEQSRNVAMIAADLSLQVKSLRRELRAVKTALKGKGCDEQLGLAGF